MPYKTIWVKPEVFMCFNGVTIYHTYEENELECGRQAYWFTTDVNGTECDDSAFDVRDLPGWHDVGEHFERCRKVIRAAINDGAIKKYAK